METNDILNKKVGNKEIPRLMPKEILVQGIRVDEKKKSDGKKAGDILVLISKHPDRAEVIELTQIMLIRGDKVFVTGLWVNLDDDGNIQKGSPIDKLLALSESATIKDLVNKKLQTVVQTGEIKYLCVKGY